LCLLWFVPFFFLPVRHDRVADLKLGFIRGQALKPELPGTPAGVQSARQKWPV